jgi:outer membrane lipoprotein-sorting protein
MTRFAILLPIAALWCFFAAPPVPSPSPADPAALESVLKKMDSVAATFRSTQAEFEWDSYEKVIDEVDDVESGSIYYRRNDNGIEMMAEVKKAGSTLATQKAEPKFVLFSKGMVQMYQPKVNQVTEFDLGKKHSDFESYVVLGFGGSGKDLQKAFNVTYDGEEKVNGVNAAKLKLEPKSGALKNTYSQIILWIDPDRGISVQQQFFQPQGDYRLAKYSDIQVNGKKIPDEVFKLKTNSKTQFVSPKG